MTISSKREYELHKINLAALRAFLSDMSRNPEKFLDVQPAEFAALKESTKLKLSKTESECAKFEKYSTGWRRLIPTSPPKIMLACGILFILLGYWSGWVNHKVLKDLQMLDAEKWYFISLGNFWIMVSIIWRKIDSMR